jgi:hypothetical protein
VMLARIAIAKRSTDSPENSLISRITLPLPSCGGSIPRLA